MGEKLSKFETEDDSSDLDVDTTWFVAGEVTVLEEQK